MNRNGSGARCIARPSRWAAIVVLAASLLTASSAATAEPSSAPPPEAPLVGALEKSTIPRTAAPSTDPGTGVAKAARPAPASSGISLTRVLLSLALVLGVIFLLRWIGRRMMGNTVGLRSTRAVQVLSRSMISPRQQFLLVQVGRRLVVVADSAGQMSPVCEITDPDEVASLVTQVHEEKASTLTKNFGSLFGRASENFEPSPRDNRGDARAAEEPNIEPVDETLDAGMREDLTALAQKVKSLSRQFHRT